MYVNEFIVNKHTVYVIYENCLLVEKDTQIMKHSGRFTKLVKIGDIWYSCGSYLYTARDAINSIPKNTCYFPIEKMIIEKYNLLKSIPIDSE